MLFTCVMQWSFTKRIILFDVDFVVDSLAVHDILTTVIVNIIVNKSTDPVKPLSICKFSSV